MSEQKEGRAATDEMLERVRRRLKLGPTTCHSELTHDEVRQLLARIRAAEANRDGWHKQVCEDAARIAELEAENAAHDETKRVYLRKLEAAGHGLIRERAAREAAEADADFNTCELAKSCAEFVELEDERDEWKRKAEAAEERLRCERDGIEPPAFEDNSTMSRLDLMELIDQAERLRGDREGGKKTVNLEPYECVASRSEFVVYAGEIRRTWQRIAELEAEKDCWAANKLQLEAENAALWKTGHRDKLAADLAEARSAEKAARGEIKDLRERVVTLTQERMQDQLHWNQDRHSFKRAEAALDQLPDLVRYVQTMTPRDVDPKLVLKWWRDHIASGTRAWKAGR